MDVALLAVEHAFVINGWWAGIIAAVALVLVIVLAHVLIVKSTPRPEASDAAAVRRRGLETWGV